MSTSPKTAFNAWYPDAVLTLSFYIIYGISYAFTLLWLPGVGVSVFTKALGFLYLTYVSIMQAINLGTHPASEASLWTMNNWWTYAFRRIVVEWVLMYATIPSTSIPFVNWITNAILIALSYVNMFVL